MIYIEAPKRDTILAGIKGWIRASKNGSAGIPFSELCSVITKMCCAFISIPSNKGMRSLCNSILSKEHNFVFLHNNEHILTSLMYCCTFLRKSTLAPTKCTGLVSVWPDFVDVKDVSRYGVGGVIIRDNEACTITVFQMEWPPDINNGINWSSNPNGNLTNSDLKFSGLLLIFMIMKKVCKFLSSKHVVLWSTCSALGTSTSGKDLSDRRKAYPSVGIAVEIKESLVSHANTCFWCQ